MNPTDLIESSSLLWLMGTGLVLGALHALEPGHAKTMIASFVVATRGSVPQAVLLGLSAAFSHSVLIWVLAGAALYFGDRYIGDDVEPWLQLGSGVVIVGIGLTMIWRLARTDQEAHRHGGHGDDHHHDHAHGHDHGHDHGGDAHARSHARQIEQRFDGRAVTTRQIALFGLSSGLMPCPAALTMLLVCLRLKRIALGIGLVTAFSLGLAVTLVSLGVIAALGVAHASRRLAGFDRWTGLLPYVSGALVIGVGVFMGVSGFLHLA